MRKVFHVLPEGESFSEFHGGAISRWVANVLRDDPAGVVVAVDSDGSWRHPREAVVSLPWMRAYGLLQRLTRQRTPWLLRKRLLQWGLRSTLANVRRGDVVWVHNRPEFACAVCDRVHGAGATVVLHMHNLHLPSAKRRIVEEMHVDRIVFVSEYLLRASSAAIRRHTPSEVLYNGAEGTLFAMKAPKGRDERRALKVLFASRLVAEKGPHIFAEALSCLDAEGAAVEGIVVGGVQFGSVKENDYVRELKRCAPPNLRFIPYCAGTKLAEIFHQADVFCLPSVWDDPFPLAPLEAMAAGLPVVATESGGIPEALRHGGGILVQRNSVEELADALRALAGDAALRSRLSEEAHQSFLDHFQWKHVRTNYKAMVDRVAHA